MSEKKRSRRRKDDYTGPGEQQPADKPSKDEIQVAKWMKKNVKTKKTKFLSHNVEYFTSSKAIDALMKSKFASGDKPLLLSREHAVEFLDLMLEHKFFHRARKVPVTIDEPRTGEGASSKPAVKSKEEKASSKSSKDKEETKKEAEAEAEQSGANGNDETAGSAGGGAGGGGGGNGDKKEQKRKRKIRLDMHPEQIFVDGSEAYVWIYDPIPLHYWIYGLILLLGAIGICLFPLWPAILRQGVYYLSVAAAGFLVFILALSVVRLIVFAIVWILTGGKLNFWIFPNLTEDVGFFASFWPLYESNYVTEEGKSKSSQKSKSKSHKKKEKDSDAEEDAAADDDVAPLEPEKIEEIKEHDADALLRLRHTDKSEQFDDAASSSTCKAAGGESSTNSSAAAAEPEAKGSASPSESESEISGRDYEIINASEVQNVNN